jgi:capsular polysaccharide biosynthesis protein
MHEFKNKNRNLTISKNYSKIFNILKEIISKKYNINYDNNHKVLYGRSDCNSRKLLNTNNIINKFDLIIDDMSKLSFEEQVKIFMKTSHFVTTEGAHLTNIIFMNKNAQILDICNTYNSWQKMFGTSNLIKHFELFINKSGNFNDNIIMNNNLENKILNFIK